MNQFLHYFLAITFFCVSAKSNVSSQSTFDIAQKTLEKSTHFMLTHVLVCHQLGIQKKKQGYFKTKDLCSTKSIVCARGISTNRQGFYLEILYTYTSRSCLFRLSFSLALAAIFPFSIAI